MSSDNEETATQLKDDLPQLRAHREVWGQKDLLSNIISRYFIVTGELGGTKWPVWKVDEKSSEGVDDSLDRLNIHLENLMDAKLQTGEPWLIQVIPYPERQFRHQKPLSDFGLFL